MSNNGLRVCSSKGCACELLWVGYSQSQLLEQVPTNIDGSINVKLSDEQLDKIIPKNADGSINVKMAPNAVVDVNIQEISGTNVGWMKMDDGRAALPICPPAGHGSGNGWGWNKW